MSALLFAEGTRSRTGELLPFKNAPFGLAIAAQVPVCRCTSPTRSRSCPRSVLPEAAADQDRDRRSDLHDGDDVERRQELRERVHARSSP